MSKKILVVDDEMAVGKLISYQLQGFGYNVTYVTDGLTALQRLQREQPDLVLLDVVMPHMSGWDVCRQIRASSNIPVIMLTGKSAEADIVAGLSAGADDYIAKPFSMHQLQARIEAVLRRANEPNGRRRHSHDVPAQTKISVPTVAEVQSNHLAKELEVAAPTITMPAPAPAPTPSTIGKIPPPDGGPVTSPAPKRLGQQFRDARVARAISLRQAEQECNVRWEFLQAIEQENYSYVPRDQLRIALRAYAQYLNLDLRPTASNGAPMPRARASTTPLIALMLVVMLVVVVGLYVGYMM